MLVLLLLGSLQGRGGGGVWSANRGRFGLVMVGVVVLVVGLMMGLVLLLLRSLREGVRGGEILTFANLALAV